MSKATKRKIVAKEVLDDYIVPEEAQEIVKVVGSRGNNLHEVENDRKDRYLVSMPSKYRKNVWIKRGDFLIVKSIEEGDKVKAEIVSILYKDQIKYIQEVGKWPLEFSDGKKSDCNEQIPSDLLPPDESDDDSDTYLGDTVVNINHPDPRVIDYNESSSDENTDSGDS